jgi:siroheme synthase/uroporphyrinogen-III synthase
MEKTGKVYLAGAGPGDVGLVTMRAAGALRRADVIVCDQAVEKCARHFQGAGVEIIIVAANRDDDTAEERLTQTLIEQARRPRTVVRLFSGDPFLSGAAVSEALRLKAAAVPFEIVPGISTTISASMNAGIPVLQPGVADSVLIVRGPFSTPVRSAERVEEEVPRSPATTSAVQAMEEDKKSPGVKIRRRKKGPAGSAQHLTHELRLSGSQNRVVSMDDSDAPVRKQEPLLWSPDDTVYSLDDPAHIENRINSTASTSSDSTPMPPPTRVVHRLVDEQGRDWNALCTAARTLVFLEAERSLEYIRAGLLMGGRASAEPVAAIVRGGSNRQSTYETTIERMVSELQHISMRDPVMLVVGDTVSLRNDLNVYEQRPLYGLSIVQLDAGTFDEGETILLEEAGAQVERLRILQPRSVAGLPEILEELCDDLRMTNCLIFTEVDAVEAFFAALEKSRIDLRIIPIWCEIIGMQPEARAALAKRGLIVTDLERETAGAKLLDYLDKDLKGQRLLLISESSEFPDLPEELRLRGAYVTELPAIHAEPNTSVLNRLRETLVRRRADLLVVKSPQTLEALHYSWDEETFLTLLEDVPVVCIGRDTIRAAEKIGVPTVLECESPDPARLMKVLMGWRTGPPR